MASRWRKGLFRRALEEAIYELFDTRERVMIASLIVLVSILVIWLRGGFEVAHSELINRLSVGAVIGILFVVFYVWKLLTIPKKSFQIILGREDPYTTIKPSGVNLSRTVRVMLKNNTLDEISNGSLHIRHLEPPNNGYREFLLEGGITLGPHKNKFIDVAAYNEGTSEAAIGSWITLIIPNSRGYLMPATFGRLPVRSHKFHLTFSSLDVIIDDIYCRLFVDSDHVLHLEEGS
jgi:hypothetical protein